MHWLHHRVHRLPHRISLLSISSCTFRWSNCIAGVQVKNTKASALLECSHLAFNFYQCLQVHSFFCHFIEPHQTFGCRCTSARTYQCSRNHFTEIHVSLTHATATSCFIPTTCALARACGYSSSYTIAIISHCAFIGTSAYFCRCMENGAIWRQLPFCSTFQWAEQLLMLVHTSAR